MISRALLATADFQSGNSSVTNSRDPRGDECLDVFEHFVALSRPERAVRPGEFYETRGGNPSGHVTPGLDAYRTISASMHDERGNRDARQELSHVDITQRRDHLSDCSRTRCGAQQPSPPRACVRISGKTRGEHFDAGGTAPLRDESLHPSFVLSGPQGEWILFRPTPFGERAEQYQSGETLGCRRSQSDARRPTFGCTEQHSATTRHCVEHRSNVIRGRIDIWRQADSIGQTGSAAIEEDDATRSEERREG